MSFLLKKVSPDLCAFVLFFVVVFSLYFIALDSPWYLDDRVNILNNPLVKSPKLDFSSFFSPRGPAYLSFSLNYYLHDFWVTGFRFVNLIIHSFSSVLVYLICKRVFPGGRKLPFLAALIFAVHPLQTQSVTYVVQRMSSMAGMFGLWSLYNYILGFERYVREKKLDFFCGLYFVSCIFFYLSAFLTKQNLIVLPFVILLFDFYFLKSFKRTKSELDIKKISLFCIPILLLAGLFLYVQFLRDFPEKGFSILTRWGDGQVAPWTYFMTEFGVLWLYLKLFLVPYPQMLMYNIPWAESFFSWKVLSPLGGIIGLVFVAFRFRIRLPFLSFGIFWFLICLSVESSFIPLHPVFEHRLYLPIVGLSIATVGSLPYFFELRTTVMISTLFLILLAGLTIQRNRLWKDDLAFFKQNSAHTRPSEGLTLALSKRLNEHGEYREAEGLIRKFLVSHPESTALYNNLAVAQMAQGDNSAALTSIADALKKGAESPQLGFNKCRALRSMGENKQAIQACQEALQLQAGFLPGMAELAYLYVSEGQFSLAEPLYQRIIRRTPQDADAQMNLGLLQARRGDLGKAIISFQKASQGAPDRVQVWYALAITAQQLGDQECYDKARTRVRELNPDMAKKLRSLR